MGFNSDFARTLLEYGRLPIDSVSKQMAVTKQLEKQEKILKHLKVSEEKQQLILAKIAREEQQVQKEEGLDDRYWAEEDFDEMFENWQRRYIKKAPKAQLNSGSESH